MEVFVKQVRRQTSGWWRNRAPLACKCPCCGGQLTLELAGFGGSRPLAADFVMSSLPERLHRPAAVYVTFCRIQMRNYGQVEDKKNLKRLCQTVNYSRWLRYHRRHLSWWSWFVAAGWGLTVGRPSIARVTHYYSKTWAADTETFFSWTGAWAILYIKYR